MVSLSLAAAEESDAEPNMKNGIDQIILTSAHLLR